MSTPTIRTGDTVLHRPTGETWTVAYVQDDRLAWCGWPPGEAKLADCDLVASCSDEESAALLRQIADMQNSHDARCRYARRALGLEAA